MFDQTPSPGSFDRTNAIPTIYQTISKNSREALSTTETTLNLNANGDDRAADVNDDFVHDWVRDFGIMG